MTASSTLQLSQGKVLQSLLTCTAAIQKAWQVRHGYPKLHAVRLAYKAAVMTGSTHLLPFEGSGLPLGQPLA